MGTAIRPDPRDPEGLEDLQRLPPLDGDGSDGPEAPVAADGDLETDGGEGREGDLDDSTPASAGQSVDFDELGEATAGERAWLDEPSDNQAIDLGDDALAGGMLEPTEENVGKASDITHLLDEAEEPTAPDDDFAAGERAEGLEAIAEDGPTAADEDLRDEDLPSLDADEEDGGVEDASLLDERLARGEAHEPVGVPWSSAPWLRVGAPVGLRGVAALACVPRGALVAWCGEGTEAALVQVDLEGTKRTVRAEGLAAGGVSALAAQGARLVAVVGASSGTEKVGLFLSHDAGERFELLDGADDAIHAVPSGQRVWAVTSEGALLSWTIADAAVGDAGAPSGSVLERHGTPAAVKAVAEDGQGGIVALAVDPQGRPAALVYGAANGSTRSEAIALPTVVAQDCAPGVRREDAPEWVIGARGEFVVLAQGGHVFLRSSRDAAWQPFVWEGVVTAASFVDDHGALLAAVFAPSDDVTALVCVDVAGRAAVVALVGAPADDPDSDGRALALACDDAHGVVWAAGGFGIAAFSRPSKVGSAA